MMTAIGQTGATMWSIQYLRAAAAVGVVAFHQLQMRHWVFLIGEHGVDLFFVISGFIMVALTDARHTTARTFVLDRIARIVPPYWLATACAFLFTAVDPRFYHGSTDLALLAKSLAFIPSINPFGQIQPTLYLGWTLNYEMFFYAVFALTLLMPRGRLILLTTLFALLVLIGALLRPTGAMETVYTDPLLLEFAAGAILGWLFGARMNRAAVPLQALVALAVALALAALSFWSPRLAFGAGAVALIAIGLFVERAGHMPRIAWLKRIGDASFAIYLFQQFAFVGTSKALNALFAVLLHRAAPQLLIQLLGIAAAIVLGVLLFTYLERPMTKAVKRWLRGFSSGPVALRAPS
ncbi:acyltransferase family protein [Sphingomonas pituitosa]|uniref:acyltransferase family protein n=1 Tax=Sphingomonas pituitosa TaxID=99597 RepID=UPI0008343A4D|nr:acyltransferase [Sphingomonas pituitosa]